MEVRYTFTSYLNYRVAESEEMAKAVTEALKRFVACDWGKVNQEDKEANNRDLVNREGHVLARYDSPEGDIYINLEFSEDENIACIMFVDEY